MSERFTCSIDGCSGVRWARDLCSKHYQRLRKNGAPLAGRTENGAPRRFFEEVVMTWTEDACLAWPFTKNSDGRGQMRDGEKLVLVHRRVCEEVNGPPPTPEHEAAHSCGKGHLACVTKGHLSWKTHAENMADKFLHGTTPRGASNHFAKLTEFEVLQIREMRGAGTNRALAQRYGISPQTVTDIQYGKSWAWLETPQNG